MNRRQTALLQAAVWTLAFLAPLSFLKRGSGVTLGQYLMTGMWPLATMLVFYLNYLWLIPRYFVRGEKEYYFLIDGLLCIGLGVPTTSG